MQLKLSLLIIGFGLSFPGYALDLITAYQDARQQDPVFAAAQATWQAGQEKLPQGLALLLPTVGVAANTTYNDADSQIGGQRKFNANGYTITASQPLYRKQNFASYEQAKYQVTQANAQFGVAQQDLVLRVAQAYFDVLLAQDNVALSAAQKTAIGEQLAQAKRNFEVGTATITDTHEAQARYDLVVSQEIAAGSDLEIKRHAMEQIIGKLPDQLKALGPTMPLLQPEPGNMDAWVAVATRDSLQVQIQQAALEIAREEVERNRAGHYPTLDVVATYGDNTSLNTTSIGSASNESKVSTIGLQLNFPIFTGGSVNSRVREALANEEKARQDLENTRRTAAQQARQAFLGVANGTAQVKALEQALVSSQSSLDSSKLGQEVGVRTSVDVLNAQQQLFSARRDLFQARYNYLLNRLRLKAAAGSLGVDDMQVINQYLTQP